MLAKEKNGAVYIADKKKQEIISELTAGVWNENEQNLFLDSQKELIVLVEGKHDKVHFEIALAKLKEDYPDLEFDIFDLNGSKNIRPFMVGLSCGKILPSNKNIVAIYDNDKEGFEATKQNFNKDKNPVYRLVGNNNEIFAGYFAIMLPKPSGYICDCTIENLYSSDKYESAFNQACQEAAGKFGQKSLNEIANDIKEKSKKNLADMANYFPIEDFIEFRQIFDILNKIKTDEWN